MSLAALGDVRGIAAISLTVGDLGRVLPFYTNTLTFVCRAIRTNVGPELDARLGLGGSRTRTAELQLGQETVLLTEHLTHKGRPVPADSRSFDHWFQHIAIVVRDMDAAYERLRRAGVRHVSTAPQTLPAWNKDAGGIRAFYFRDPEDHVLEVIWFPSDKGAAQWHVAESKADSSLFLGIDHTAIVVSDTDRSLAFYTTLLGLRVAGGAENHGTEQEHLNQVFGARLRITALRAESGPGIELLEYIAPPGGRPLPNDATARDLVFWNTHLTADNPQVLAARLAASGMRTVSLPGSIPAIVRDPDGHALQLQAFDPSVRATTH
jgi:catechol 2,3-dioxygenase-like lactoylglutathione lyase family enzyme